MTRFIRSLAASAFAVTCLAAAASASAATLTSIDFTPIDGTSWSDPFNSPVRLNFGSLGEGTISFTSVNGGGGTVTRDDYGDLEAKYGPTTLANGDSFAPTNEVLFTINPSALPGLSGFTMTVTLDSGNFAAGSVLSPRSLDSYVNWGTQSFVPGAGLGAPDSVQLPTDGNNIPDLVLNASTGGYAASVDGRSKGLAFEVDSVNSFSATFLATPNFQPGGVAMTFAMPTPAIPEPSTYALLIGGIGALGFMSRRRAGK